jgi:hypothetical protein
MSHYDNGIVCSYSFGSLAFGGSGSAWALKPPAGLNRGKIVDIQVQVSVLFTAVTTPAYVRLGWAADDDYYAQLSMGTAAATDAYGIRNVGYDVAVFKSINMVVDAISQVEVVFVAATGGTPAGTGVPNIMINWW